MLTSSAGQAFLAWQPETERQELITAALAAKESDSNGTPDPQLMEKWIEETRNRGYAIHNYDTPIEGTQVISVPLLHQGRTVAVLALVSLRGVLSIKGFEQHIFPHVNRTAEQIVEEFARFDTPALNQIK